MVIVTESRCPVRPVAGGSHTGGMSPREYRFHSTWRIAAHPDIVFAALAALDAYPTWWPGVREARALDAERCALTIRSVLPMDLRLVACSARRDPTTRVLEAHLTGDLVGFSRWTLVPQEAGTAALFEEHVVPYGGSVRRFSFARPVLRANHAIMMRRGEAGLRARLAAKAAHAPAATPEETSR